MVNLYVGVLFIATTAVGRIALCAIAGIVVSRNFSHLEETLTGLSYVAMRVFLPCLLFSNLCLSVTWEGLRKFYWAPLFALLSMGLGFLSSMLVRIFLTREYHAVAVLASTFQNGLAFPVSVLLNLKGIDWLTRAAVADAQSYVFLYNVICSVGLWALGDPMIELAKKRELGLEEARREEEELAGRPQHQTSIGFSGEAANDEGGRVSYPFEAPRHNPGLEDSEEQVPLPRPRAATAREQLGWYRPAHAKDKPITPPPGSPAIVVGGETSTDGAAEVKPTAVRLKRLGLIALKSFQSPTVLLSVIAIFISLTPPLRWLAESPLGEPFVGGLALVGKGAVPLQLLVVGFSIWANRSGNGTASLTKNLPAAASPAASGTPLANEDGTIIDVSASPLGKGNKNFVIWVTSKMGPEFVLIWYTVVMRLVIIPSVCFLFLHILVKTGVMTNEKPFLLATLVAIISPSAMDSTLICSAHNYHARDYARVIFFMYLSTILTTSVWLFLFTLYLKD
ncbi:hypothetical protein LSCM1_06266 [Leishmania martiniquensis]|uniref:Uncharacterized protein n=1 Tax=Leishmania martiniquensis TaxID=1580590 RepID=A0A836KPD4_9TRYP|nr:hypothetical protein LSCM1_06266 [Leishmania martiniquensis]